MANIARLGAGSGRTAGARPSRFSDVLVWQFEFDVLINVPSVHQQLRGGAYRPWGDPRPAVGGARAQSAPGWRHSSRARCSARDTHHYPSPYCSRLRGRRPVVLDDYPLRQHFTGLGEPHGRRCGRRTNPQGLTTESGLFTVRLTALAFSGGQPRERSDRGDRPAARRG